MRYLLALVCAPAVLSACSTPDETDVAPLVRTQLIDERAASGTSAYTGVVRARIESDLGFRVAGRITGRLVNPGDSVRRGQALMRVDPGDLALAASAAASQVDAASAAAVRTAADVRRLQGLVEAGAVAASDYDAAVAARNAAAANLSAARATAAQAGRQRGYATLFADADGTVIDVLAQPGQVVAPGTPIIRLAQSGAREAAIAIPETALAGLPRLATATVYGSNARVAATLREVAGAADPATRTFAARYSLAGKQAASPLGATVTVFIRRDRTATLDVPLAALFDPGSGPGLWIVGADRKVRFRRVSVVRLGEETAAVAAAGLTPGTRFVSLGAQLLREGQAVRLAPGPRP